MFGNLTNQDRGMFDEFRRLEQQMDEMFGNWPWPAGIRSAARGSYPPVNVGATPEKVDVYLFAAGLAPADLDISIQQNLLTVSGKRETPEVENATFYRQERYSGAFNRAISLPDDVDPDRCTARYENGVLHISVQRQEAAKPRQVEIK
jgi:HSP20 family protein